MNKEQISAKHLYFLWHPKTDMLFSGYGLAVQPDRPEYLIGLLMIDQLQPADPIWLAGVKALFGEYQLYVTGPNQERGIACQLWIAPDSQAYVRQFKISVTPRIAQTLAPLLQQVPNPRLKVCWHESWQIWTAEFQEADQEPIPEVAS